jgi:predicted adenylyl cyclase CyaB
VLNLEIKVKILRKSNVIKRLKKLGARPVFVMEQTDYYFQLGANKEKLRIINNHEYQLITYHRIEKQGRKDSRYGIKKLGANEKDMLLKSRKIVKTVNKTRELWEYGNTRIHIDCVENLGNFLELETVIKGISLAWGEDEFKTVANALRIDFTDAVAASYSDLVPALA